MACLEDCGSRHAPDTSVSTADTKQTRRMISTGRSVRALLALPTRLPSPVSSLFNLSKKGSVLVGWYGYD